jgi:hypothetical protein
MKSVFEQRQQHFARLSSAYQKTFNTWATIRLVAFAAGIIGLYYTYQNNGFDNFILLLLVWLVAFVWIVSKHQAIKLLRDKHRALEEINHQEINRLAGRFLDKNTGQQFDEIGHYYSKDLDIFGDFSVFKLLNRTHTYLGGATLAAWLKHPSSFDAILDRQAACAELSPRIDFRQDLQATAMLNTKVAEPSDSLLAWCQEPNHPKINLPFYKAVRFLPILTIGLILAWMLGSLPFAWAGLLLGVHGLILSPFFKNISATLDKTTRMAKALSAYSNLAQLIDKETFEAKILIQKKAELNGATQAIQNLGGILTNLSYRQNVYFSILIGLPSLWDLIYFTKLENWRQQYRTQLPIWLSAIAQLEALNSLAGLAFANPKFVVPVIKKESNKLVIKALGHPLLSENQRVCNDVTFGGIGQTMILTGSNMSGKSTFQRTLALNIILAQMGAVVCAESFESGQSQVFTSMRSQDSLEENTSSFYAELKRLKQLIELVEKSDSKPVFYLLDEILKGTNSKDRHDGAKALVMQLHKKNAFGIVSTHDVELGDELDNETFIQNYSFYSELKNGQLLFDYQLRSGVCHSFNASQLMKQVGIDIEAV